MSLRNSTFSVLLFIIIFSGCKPTKEPTGVWINPEKKPEKPYTSMFVVALSVDPEARVAVENKVAAIAISRGFKIVKSIDAINIDLKNPRLATKEEILTKAKENNCEAIFVTAVRNKKDSVQYTKEAISYSPRTDYSFYGYYNYSFFGYYTYLQPNVASSESYTQEKTIFMETSLFDTKTEVIMWSAQSQIFSPSTLESFTRAYTNTLMDQLKKEGIAKK